MSTWQERADAVRTRRRARNAPVFQSGDTKGPRVYGNDSIENALEALGLADTYPEKVKSGKDYGSQEEYYVKGLPQAEAEELPATAWLAQGGELSGTERQELERLRLRREALQGPVSSTPGHPLRVLELYLPGWAERSEAMRPADQKPDRGDRYVALLREWSEGSNVTRLAERHGVPVKTAQRWVREHRRVQTARRLIEKEVSQ